MLSELARRGLQQRGRPAKMRNGVPVMPRRPQAPQDHDGAGKRAARRMSRPALLDVNVLVALFDPDHIHHDAAHEWFAEHRRTAGRPVRDRARARPHPLQSHLLAGAERSAEVVERFRQFRASGDHQFWRDSLELTDDIFNHSFVKGHRQLTDVYLLGLAVKRNGGWRHSTAPSPCVRSRGPSGKHSSDRPIFPGV